MIVTLLIWAYTILAAWLAGAALSELLRRWLKFPTTAHLPFALTWLLGMASLGGLFSLLSLWMPLGLIAQLMVAVLTGLSWLMLKRAGREPFAGLRAFLHWSRFAQALLLLAAGAVLLAASTAPENFDTGLYHAQAIRWIETYPAVPGLANFHARFGYNSNWLLGQALFSFAFLGGPSYHLNTSVLFLVAFAYLAAGVNNLLQGRQRLNSWMRALIFPLVVYILSSEISSPGTDAPAALICWIVLSECLAYFEDTRPPGDLRPAALALISVYAVTIKLTCIPLLLASALVFGFELVRRNWRPLLVTGGLSLLIMAPWMARSVILTGYLVYPLPAVDLFQVDWKVPPGQAQYEAEAIRAWARLPRSSLERVSSLSFQAWVKEWFANQTANRRAILGLDLLAPLAFLLLFVIPGLRLFFIEVFKSAWPVWLTMYAGLAFWFFNAPDFRFGSGFIITALAFTLALPGYWLAARWSAAGRVLPRLVAAVLIGYQAFALVGSIEPRTFAARLVQPLDYPASPTVPCRTAQYTILVPDAIAYGQCWYSTFPCTPSCATGAERRGPAWQDGFRSAPQASR